MILSRHTSPYIRKDVSVKKMMLNVIIALVPIVLFAMIQNGWNGIYVILLSLVVMLLVEFIAVGLMKWPAGMKFKELFTKEGFKRELAGFNANNITCPVISALIFSLLLPARTPAYVIIVGAVVGILFGKLIYGAYGNNIFNPAAVGFIFVKLCFGAQLDAALSTQSNDLFGAIAGGTPLAQIAGNLANFGEAMKHYSLLDLFLGNVPGAMGEVSTLLILISWVYLICTRAIDLRASLGMLLSFIVMTLCVGIVLYTKNGTNAFTFTLYEVMAGGLLFASVFMVTDPVTSPVTKFGNVLYGVIAGLIAALIRYLGAYPEGACFAILLANMLAPTIDYFMRGKPNTYTWKQMLGLGITIVVFALVIGFAVSAKVSAPAEAATNLIVGLGGRF